MKRFRSNDLLFFTLLIGVLLWGAFTFIKDETPTSKAENRALNTFQHFTFNSFVEGTFQDNLEAAISDQFAGSEQIRLSYNGWIRTLPTFGIKEKICQGRYLNMASNTNRKRGIYNCEDYIIYLPEPMTQEQKTIIDENIKSYNNLNKIAKTYYYFVDDTSSFDFADGAKVVDYKTILKTGLKGEAGLSFLQYDSFEDHKKYFYKTDHHWDYRGSYQGFLDITDMLGIKDQIQPDGIINNHEPFFGSQARGTTNYDIQEEFKVYRFAIPDHKTFINGEETNYNHIEEYENHQYEYEKTTNFYGEVYGIDYGEIIFDFNQPKKENLLIISNSYSNAINELIAQYFNKTYVIDLRFYKEEKGANFNPASYINEKRIDKVLMIMSPTFIRATEPNRGLETDAV